MARSENCTVVVLPVRGLDQAAGDAKLNMLVSAGWRPLTAVTIADAKGGPETHIVMSPPLPPPSPRWIEVIAAGSVAGVVAGVVIVAALLAGA